MFILTARNRFRFFYGHTIFQRFGAIIVGFAVLHIFENKSQVLHINAVEKLSMYGVWKNLTNIPNLQVNPYETLDENTLGEINKIAKRIATTDALERFLPRQDLLEEQQLEIAEIVVLGLIKLRDEESEVRKKLLTLSRNEYLLAVIGTIVWAFGDWVTNYLFHCNGFLICT